MQTVLLYLIRAAISALLLLPQEGRVRLITWAVRLFYLLRPKATRVAMRNLSIVFPHLSEAEHRDILRRSCTSFARMIVDTMRLHELTPEWVRSHVDLSAVEEYAKFKADGRPAMLATGHLGSFDLMGHCLPVSGHPIAFIIRNFKMEKIDQWFIGIRERYGNKVISRKGAVSQVLRTLREGRDVAILFDQNVRAKHAVFVEWFGKQAATPATLGFAAVRMETAVFVASMEYLGDDRYRLNGMRVEVEDIYRDTALSPAQKMALVTQRAATVYAEMIRSHPEDWFWMHRRFRTRPEGDVWDPYA